MPRLIEAGGRTWLAPEQVKFVQWRALSKPFFDSATGTEMHASVTVETYHDSYRIPCATVEDARTLAHTLVSEKARIDLADAAADAANVASIPALRARGKS